MATVSIPITKRAPEPIPIPVSRLHRLSVAQYEKMTELEILGAADRVELLNGWIVDKVTQNPPHNAAIDCASEMLRERLPSGWLVREQKAIALADSMPEPDLVVVKGTPRRYAARHPRPQDIALIVEVADSTLADDRKTKGSLYARDGLACYWIVNLVDEQIEVYSRPKRGRTAAYQDRHDYHKGQSVPLAINGRDLGAISVQDLLP